jgi:hypothetical protein
MQGMEGQEVKMVIGERVNYAPPSTWAQCGTYRVTGHMPCDEMRTIPDCEAEVRGGVPAIMNEIATGKICSIQHHRGGGGGQLGQHQADQ